MSEVNGVGPQTAQSGDIESPRLYSETERRLTFWISVAMALASIGLFFMRIPDPWHSLAIIPMMSVLFLLAKVFGAKAMWLYLGIWALALGVTVAINLAIFGPRYMQKPPERPAIPRKTDQEARKNAGFALKIPFEHAVI